MKWGLMTPWERVRVRAIAILAAGLTSSIVIYLAAQPPPGNPLGYDPEDTKKYVHDMELYGGKANLLAYGFRQWFGSLWHGRRLAFTVAGLTVIVACAFVFFAAPLPPEPQAEGLPGQKPPDRG
jgi:hypothetical protein